MLEWKTGIYFIQPSSSFTTMSVLSSFSIPSTGSASSSSSSAVPHDLRALTLHSPTARVSIPVPASPLSAWVTSEVLAQDFHDWQTTIDQGFQEPDAEDDASPSRASRALEAQAVLLARFLSFTSDRITASETSELGDVLLAGYRRFNELFLASANIHSLVQHFEPESRTEILTAYFKAFTVSRAVLGDSKVPVAHSSALLDGAKRGTAELYAIFGGQGVNEVRAWYGVVRISPVQYYFDELQSLFDVYQPFIETLLQQVTRLLMSLAATADEADFSYYSEGLELFDWLKGARARPALEYLASIPISFPLIGVTQMAQYVVSCRVTDLTPGEMRDRFHGTTGHSQGLISAVAIAASDSWTSLEENVLKATRLLFYLGLRGQEAFPLLSLEPQIVADSIANNEGTPTPMLSVNGLSQKALEGHIKKVNAHLPAGSQVSISLFNSLNTHVVTGPAKSLYGLATSLRKVMAPPGLDQSKVPFSKRKAVFNIRFFPINVPFHSTYLEGARQKLLQSDLDGEDLWRTADLAIAVYNTETGEQELFRSSIY